MRISKYYFDIEKVDKEDFFKLSDEPLKKPFVSDAFKSTVIDAGLTGFQFELVWNSEEQLCL